MFVPERYPFQLHPERRKELRKSILRDTGTIILFKAIKAGRDLTAAADYYASHEDIFVPASVVRSAVRLRRDIGQAKAEHLERVFDRDVQAARLHQRGIPTRDGVVFLDDLLNRLREKRTKELKLMNKRVPVIS